MKGFCYFYRCQISLPAGLHLIGYMVEVGGTWPSSHLAKDQHWGIILGESNKKIWLGLDVSRHIHLIPLDFFLEHKSQWDQCFHRDSDKNKRAVKQAKIRLATQFFIAKIFNTIQEAGGSAAQLMRPTFNLREPSVHCEKRSICKG